MPTKIQTLQKQINEIKTEIRALGDLRPGTLSQQFNVCGKPGCKCKADPPQKHGPYNQLGWTLDKKSTTRFVRPAALPDVQSQLQNYARLQSLLHQWITLSIRLCDLRLKSLPSP